MKKEFKKLICVLLSVMMMVTCTSCGWKINAQEISKGYTRRSGLEAKELDENFVSAMAKFSMTLFKGLVTKDEENDLISPLSAILCLAMVANGADGETKTQMEEAFGMSISDLNENLYAYTSSLYSADDCKVNIADSIWVRDDENALHVNEEFLQANADWYDAQIYSAPFDDSTVNDINKWCEDQTDGMIDHIIDEINDNTLMYLINALSFDAEWATKYEKDDIKDYQFTNYDKSKSDVKMLKSEEYRYIEADGVVGFAKDYAGNKYSIVGLLPDESMDIYEFINSLDGDAWMKLWNSKSYDSVQVKMPEFKYSCNMKLNDTLQAMGMKNMFNEKLADFSKMGSADGGNLYCSSVCQKTFIQVDRNGTKAAAITWAVMGAKSAAPDFYYVTLDRPFVYAIVDNQTGLPLFIGAVTNL